MLSLTKQPQLVSLINSTAKSLVETENASSANLIIDWIRVKMFVFSTQPFVQGSIKTQDFAYNVLQTSLFMVFNVSEHQLLEALQTVT